MRLTYKSTIAIALVCVLAGCSQQRFAGLRGGDKEVASGPPMPSAALLIPNAPIVQAPTSDDEIQQATFAPRRENVKPAEPSPQVVEHPLSVLHQRAAQRFATMDTYIYRLKRREVVNGKKQPEELIRVSVRNEPFSVHLKWLGTEGKGREAIYVKGKYKNQMQVLLAPGDPFSILLTRASVDPNDEMARAKSRYPITETGYGALIERFGQLAAMVEKGDTSGGTAQYLGRVERPEFADKVEAVKQTLAPGNDPLLPKGGQRWWFFEVQSGLPVLLVTHDPTGEVEYYCHDNVIGPAHLDDGDFNPDRLWRK